MAVSMMAMHFLHGLGLKKGLFGDPFLTDGALEEIDHAL
jgi:hypothetical protein